MKVADLKLRAVQHSPTKPAASQWPQGTPQRLTRKLAQQIFDLISTSTDSLFTLLHAHPELPPFRTLITWKRNHLWFNHLWQAAREAQAEFLIQRSLDLAKSTTPKTAHVSRVQFDIYKYIASKFAPAVYGDKPQPTTSVSVNLAIVPQERIADLRNRLESSREHYRLVPPQVPDNGSTHTPDSTHTPTPTSTPTATQTSTPTSTPTAAKTREIGSCT